MLTPAPSKATFKSVKNYKSERWIGFSSFLHPTLPMSPFPPFPALSPSLPLWIGVCGGERDVGRWWINMLAGGNGGEVGVGITGLGPNGILGEAKPQPPPSLCSHRRTHTHIHPKIWIHQNLLGHGCSNSAEAVCWCSSSSDPGILLWFLHGCQITLPPPQSYTLCVSSVLNTEGWETRSTLPLVPVKPDQKCTLAKSRNFFQSQNLVL